MTQAAPGREYRPVGPRPGAVPSGRTIEDGLYLGAARSGWRRSSWSSTGQGREQKQTRPRPSPPGRHAHRRGRCRGRQGYVWEAAIRRQVHVNKARVVSQLSAAHQGPRTSPITSQMASTKRVSRASPGRHFRHGTDVVGVIARLQGPGLHRYDGTSTRRS